ncbi:Venom carboxylesterase-6 [Orchesella cincta]|uniref:Venom carboxylesterase-6 n=1 Tax=Orchesella cincta TaxID=48709 RepID=A0A1D2NM61_ORCCI|nr:Venom carboxylesterase-6 [Orchesella cincta]
MRGLCLSWLIVLSELIFTTTATDELVRSPVVQTKYGPVQGVIRKDHYEFRSVPYSKPPIGHLRFKVPEEPDPWTDTLDTVKFPEYCIQYNVFWNSTEGTEDCLYLSIFTPKLPTSENEKSKLPVMVYIHSGGFMFGRGAQFRGDYLMEHKNVVLVVFHYRLGSLGFLNTGDEESFGNMGMKDQMQALRFVQENIANFAGDEDRVMIFGTSAGSASVHYHIISPMSKGLFHTALSASGSALNPWAFQPNPIPNGKKLGQFLNCPVDNSKDLVECLRTKDAHDIAFTHSLFLHITNRHRIQNFYSDPIAAFGPSIENGNPDPSTRFLSDTPRNIIEKGAVNEVPWIIGYCKIKDLVIFMNKFDTDEGYEHTLGIVKSQSLLERLNTKWEEVFPITLEYVNEPPELQSRISKKVREFYFDNLPINADNPKNLSNAYSDKTFIHGIIEAARLHAKLGKVDSHPVYLFNFGYEGSHSIVTLRGHSRDGFVANHMDDIQYLLTTFLFPFIEPEARDRPFQQKYIKMITDFVATGKISAFDEDRPNDIWEPLNTDGKIRYYHITETPRMESISKQFTNRVNFWNSFPLREYQVTTAAKDEL